MQQRVRQMQQQMEDMQQKNSAPTQPQPKKQVEGDYIDYEEVN